MEGFPCGARSATSSYVQHIVWELGFVAGSALYEVTLSGSTARVCLMDSDNYQAYSSSDEYEYHGGFTDVSPVALEVPYDDYWYLVVDSNPRRITAEVTQIFD